MSFKKIMVLLLSAAAVASVFAGCSSKKAETSQITEPISQITDKDDEDTAVVTEPVKNNIVILKDESGNSLSLSPIMDTKNATMISGYIKAVADKAGNTIADSDLIDKIVAVTADKSSGSAVYSITQKDNKSVFLDYYTNDKKEVVATQIAADSKYYEVLTETGDNGIVYMRLKADSKGNPIEVVLKKNADGSREVVEKASGKSVAKNVSNSSANTNQSANSTQVSNNNKSDNTESADKVVTVTDYTSLADVNIILKKNSKADVGLDANSPIKVNLASKAYVKDGVLYLNGNGDYYVAQSSDCSTWYGKIVVTLGNKGLARVRLAGVNITSSDSSAVEFIDKDSVINDYETDSEVLISYNNTSSNKNNPDAVLSFVDGTVSSLTANGNANKGSGTINSQCKLSVKGHGTGNIYAENKNGIHAARSVGIQNVTLNIESKAGKGIRVNNLLDIEEAAKITVKSMGDAVRCGEFIMDTDVKTASGIKDKSTGSTVTLKATSSEASATTGDGIDADDSVIIRAGNLNIDVACTKAKYGIKVRRVDNEEFLKIIKDTKMTGIKDFLNTESGKEPAQQSPYYNNVKLNEKEYEALFSTKDTSPASASYQGIRTADGCDDTFRITGGTVKALVSIGRNTTALNSTNSQKSISTAIPLAGSSAVARTININGHYSSGDAKIFALFYSSSDIKSSDTVTFGSAYRKPKHTVNVKFDKSGNIGTAVPEN